MTLQSVHWHEGMFLWPQHMQLAERFLFAEMHVAQRWDVHYGWGLRSLDLDEGALANHRFVIRSLEGRLRDGTLVALPEAGRLGALELKDAFARNNELTVYLGLPHLHAGSPNVQDPRTPTSAGGEATRYLAEDMELEDENGAEPQPVSIRLLNVRLLHSSQDLTGYEVIPLARIAKSAEAEAIPKLALTYIPPVLACDAWQPLQAHILQAIYNYVGQKIEALSSQVVSRGIAFGTHSADDALLLGQLHALNSAYASLNVLAFADGIHPLLAYLELCRLVGVLAIFHDTRRPPELPRYDHDDLGGCFYRVKQYIESIKIHQPTYEERSFKGEGQRMQVELEKAWLEPLWEMYVGVKSDLPRADVIQLLDRRGRLDMKIGSSLKVDEIYHGGKAGLEFTAIGRPPRDLPADVKVAYFQINRDSQREEWENVRQSLKLAIRLNEARATVDQGQRTVQIREGGQTTPFAFTLYLVPRSH